VKPGGGGVVGRAMLIVALFVVNTQHRCANTLAEPMAFVITGRRREGDAWIDGSCPPPPAA
jgi:hypothetical protein